MLTALNRTMLELKYNADRLVCEKLGLSQSYHVGIEIFFAFACLGGIRAALNRTMLELKYAPYEVLSCAYELSIVPCWN